MLPILHQTISNVLSEHFNVTDALHLIGVGCSVLEIVDVDVGLIEKEQVLFDVVTHSCFHCPVDSNLVEGSQLGEVHIVIYLMKIAIVVYLSYVILFVFFVA